MGHISQDVYTQQAVEMLTALKKLGETVSYDCDLKGYRTMQRVRGPLLGLLVDKIEIFI